MNSLGGHFEAELTDDAMLALADERDAVVAAMVIGDQGRFMGEDDTRAVLVSVKMANYWRERLLEQGVEVQTFWVVIVFGPDHVLALLPTAITVGNG